MSATNITVIAKPIEPPPLDTPLYVDGRDGKTVGSVDFKKNFVWAVWLAKLAESTTQIIVTATVNFGTVLANSFKTELVNFAPFTIADAQHVSVVSLIPSTVGGLPLSARVVLANQLQAIIYNQTTSNQTPGDLDLQWLLIPRR